MRTFVELGKDKTSKGEGWALPSSAVPKTQTPLLLRLLSIGKPLPFKCRRSLSRCILFTCPIIIAYIGIFCSIPHSRCNNLEKKANHFKSYRPKFGRKKIDFTHTGESKHFIGRYFLKNDSIKLLLLYCCFTSTVNI